MSCKLITESWLPISSRQSRRDKKTRFLKDITAIFHSEVSFDDFEWECWAMKTPFWWYFYLFHGRLNLEQGFMSVGETAFQRFPLYALLLPPSTLFMLLRLLLTCTLTLHLLLLGQYKFFRKFHLGHAFNMQIVPCSKYHLDIPT